MAGIPVGLKGVYPSTSYMPRDVLSWSQMTPENQQNYMANRRNTGQWIGGSEQATLDYLNQGVSQYGLPQSTRRSNYGPDLSQRPNYNPALATGGNSVGSSTSGAANTTTPPNQSAAPAAVTKPAAKPAAAYPSAATWRPQQSPTTTAQPGLRTPRPPAGAPSTARYVDSSGGWGWDMGAGMTGQTQQPGSLVYQRPAGTSVQQWKDSQTGGTTGGTGTSIGGGIQGGNLTNQDIGYATSFIGGAGQVPFEVSSDAQRELRQRSQDEALQGTNRESLDLSRRGSYEQAQMDLARQMAEAESGLGYGNLLARLRDMDVTKNLTQQGYLYDLVGSVF